MKHIFFTFFFLPFLKGQSCIIITEPAAIVKGLAIPTTGTCNSTTANNDASIILSGLANVTKADKVEGSNYSEPPAFGDASNIDASSGNLQFIGLKHNQPYTIRLWQSESCFTDLIVMTPTKNCILPCPTNNCGHISVRKL